MRSSRKEIKRAKSLFVRERNRGGEREKKTLREKIREKVYVRSY